MYEALHPILVVCQQTRSIGNVWVERRSIFIHKAKNGCHNHVRMIDVYSNTQLWRNQEL